MRGTTKTYLALAALVMPVLVFAQSEVEREVTWSGEVAAIFQEKCQECHRPNSIAPMSLLSYEEAKLFAPVIRFRVENRVMPPWHVNPQVGIQDFANDRGLSDEERAAILAWVDQGAPEGDASEAPAPLNFNDALVWRLEDQMGSAPDLVVESEPFDLDAVTQDKWFRPSTPTGLTEERWVKAIEIRPKNDASRRVVHHSLAFLVQQEDGKRERRKQEQNGEKARC